MNCPSCRFSRKAPLTPEGLGKPRPMHCLRFPPTPYPLPGPGGQLLTMSLLPIVEDSHYCGEYEREQAS